MKLNVSNYKDGIIIIDVLNKEASVEIPVNDGVITFELEDDSYRVASLDSSLSLNKTVANSKGFELDESTEMLDVLDSGGSSDYSVSTNNHRVQVQVNFNTGTITVYE